MHFMLILCGNFIGQKYFLEYKHRIAGARSGCLEDGSPPWRLLGPLEQPHLAYDQFQTPLGVRVAPGGSVVVIGT